MRRLSRAPGHKMFFAVHRTMFKFGEILYIVIRGMMIKLLTVENIDHLTKVKALFQEYAGTRRNDPALIDFPKETRNLPGEYAPPGGAIILACLDDEPAGCVAVHRIEDDICEMKRLYVPPRFRRKGLGRALVTAILKEALKMGYSRMRLDTIPGMKKAQVLYESLGFHEIPAYRKNPNKGTKYYEIKLSKRPE